MPAPRRKWFVFDLGNVLLRIDYDRVVDRIASRSQSSREQLIDLMDAAGGYRDLERGRVDFKEFHQFLVNRIGYLEDLRTFRTVWTDFFAGPVEGIDEILRRVRGRYRVAFLSNSNEVHAEFIPREFPSLFERDDVFIFSHRLLCAKPEPEVFHRALELLGAEPEEVLFVDDLAENVAAAKNVGIDAFQFTTSAELARTLEDRGLLDS